jgi:hypothetical protein
MWKHYHTQLYLIITTKYMSSSTSSSRLMSFPFTHKCSTVSVCHVLTFSYFRKNNNDEHEKLSPLLLSISRYIFLNLKIALKARERQDLIRDEQGTLHLSSNQPKYKHEMRKLPHFLFQHENKSFSAVENEMRFCFVCFIRKKIYILDFFFFFSFAWIYKH